MTRRTGSPALLRLTAVALAAFVAGPASSETLGDAIALAYQTNPALLASRASLRAVDERYMQARAGLGPTVTLSGQGTYDDAHLKTAQTSLLGKVSKTEKHYVAETDAARLSFSQPLYTGGELSRKLSAANADVLAGRASLLQQEALVLNDVITAYADVMIGRALVTIAAQDVEILRNRQTETEAELKVKQVTVTDHAQTLARVIAAQVKLSQARKNLRNHEAKYAATVGQYPGELAPLPDLPDLPTDVDAAFDVADRTNPALAAARYVEIGSRARIAEARAADGLQVSLNASYSREPYVLYQKNDLHLNSYTVMVTASKPLYTNGLHSSRIREALENNNRDALKLVDDQRQVMLTLARAWNDTAESRSTLVSLQKQLVEEEKAFEGARLEQRIGIRSTIDVLNAEQEFQLTKIALFQTYHDEYLAHVALLNAMGLVRAELLNTSIDRIDPAATSRASAAQRNVLAWENLIGAIDGIVAPEIGPKSAPRTPLTVASGPAPPAAAAAPRWADLSRLLAPLPEGDR